MLLHYFSFKYQIMVSLYGRWVLALPCTSSPPPTMLNVLFLPMGSPQLSIMMSEFWLHRIQDWLQVTPWAFSIWNAVYQLRKFFFPFFFSFPLLLFCESLNEHHPWLTWIYSRKTVLRTTGSRPVLAQGCRLQTSALYFPLIFSLLFLEAFFCFLGGFFLSILASTLLLCGNTLFFSEETKWCCCLVLVLLGVLEKYFSHLTLFPQLAFFGWFLICFSQ